MKQNSKICYRLDTKGYISPECAICTSKIDRGFEGSITLPTVAPTDPQQLPTMDSWSGWED